MTEHSTTGERKRLRSGRWLLVAALPMLLVLMAARRSGIPDAPAAVLLRREAGASTASALAASASAASVSAAGESTASAPAASVSSAGAPAINALAASALAANAPDAGVAEAAVVPSGAAAAEAPPAEMPECELTPLTSDGLARALREGHIRAFGTPPQPDRWACAWAHCAFEQDRGRAIYANNLGHVTARTPTGHVCRRHLRERVARNPDRWKLLDVWFRVFDSPEEGALAYWRLLSTRYHSVLARCDEADPHSAAKRLAAIGYFTGPEEPYVNGLTRLFVRARSKLIPELIAADGPTRPGPHGSP